MDRSIRPVRGLPARGTARMTTATGQANFWLASLPLSENAAHCQVLALADPPEAAAADTIPRNAVAVEVWRWADERHWAVLVSTADTQDAPTQFTCLFGVTSDPS